MIEKDKSIGLKKSSNFYECKKNNYMYLSFKRVLYMSILEIILLG